MIPPRSAIPVFRPTTATSGFVGHDFTVCFKTTNRGHTLYGAGLSPTTYCVQNKRKLSFDTDSCARPEFLTERPSWQTDCPWVALPCSADLRGRSPFRPDGTIAHRASARSQRSDHLPERSHSRGYAILEGHLKPKLIQSAAWGQDSVLIAPALPEKTLNTGA